MTFNEKLSTFQVMVGSDEEDEEVVSTYLNMAKQRILNHRFPFRKNKPADVEPCYDYLQIELAVTLYNQRGAEGQSKHSENSVSRSWRTVTEILSDIPREGGVPR